MISRLINNWVYGGTLAGVLLLAMTPLLTAGWPPDLILTFLALPLYMLHQWEEHDDDRFRRFVNRMLGSEALSPAAVFVINVPGVWGVIAAALYLAWNYNSGYAFIAVYLVLVNGVVHALGAVAKREYNPGLVTAVLLFLPFSAVCLWMMRAATAYHAIGLGSALAIHIAIVVYANWGRAK